MTFQKITDRIFYLPAENEAYSPIAIAIAGREKTLVIDAGSTPARAEAIQNALAELDRKADYLLISHSHWDHSFGLSAWPEDTLSISHEKTLGHLEQLSRLNWDDDALYGRMEREEESEFFARLIKKSYPDLSEIQIALPKKYYASSEVLDLGDLQVELHYLPSDHADDNTLVYVPQEKFLFVGDILAENIRGESWFYTYHKLASAIDSLKNWDADIIAESHNEPLGRIAFLDILTQLEKINETVRTAMDKGIPDQAPRLLEEAMDRPLSEVEEEWIQSCLYGYFME